MADLSFSQPERRSLLWPVLGAVAVLTVVALLLFRLSPRSTAEAAVTHADVFAAHTVFKSESNVVGADPAQDDLYVLATVRITDKLRLPLFLKDFTAMIVTADGAQTEPASAVEKSDLANLYTSFPAVGRLAAHQTAPLLVRESRIEPGQTIEGYVVLHLPATKADWDARKDAVLLIDLYHQEPLKVSVPKSVEAVAGTPGAAAKGVGKAGAKR